MATNAGTSGQNSVRLPPSSELRDLPPVPVYDVTKFPDARTQTLRALLEAGHVTVAPLRDPELILHSHLPHVCCVAQLHLPSTIRSYLTTSLQLLGSAYALGANSDQLKRSYEHEITQLVPIARGFTRGDAISKDNWRSFLGHKQ